ncbi:MAG: recombination regulator RecX [Ottowia sp.]
MPEPSLKARALRLLARREYSRAELERKLAAHASEPGELAQALDELSALGFINEERVAASLLHRRAPRLGAARVLQEMKAKGLGAAALADAAAQLRETELERARAVWQKKFGAPAASLAERARQARFLASRGFSGDVVRRVLQAGGGDLPDES